MDLVKIGSAIVLVITTMNDTHKIWQEYGRNYIGIDKSTCTFTKNYMYFLVKLHVLFMKLHKFFMYFLRKYITLYLLFVKLHRTNVLFQKLHK